MAKLILTKQVNGNIVASDAAAGLKFVIPSNLYPVLKDSSIALTNADKRTDYEWTVDQVEKLVLSDASEVPIGEGDLELLFNTLESDFFFRVINPSQGGSGLTESQVRMVIMNFLSPGRDITINPTNSGQNLEIAVAHGGSGGGTPTPTMNDKLFYGFLDENEDPLTADISGFTEINNPASPLDILTGVATANQRLTLIVDTREPLTSIIDERNVEILPDFPRNANQLTISGQTYYVRQSRPRVAGYNAQLTLRHN